jgi:hypothetical protein
MDGGAEFSAPLLEGWKMAARGYYALPLPPFRSRLYTL